MKIDAKDVVALGWSAGRCVQGEICSGGRAPGLMEPFVRLRNGDVLPITAEEYAEIEPQFNARGRSASSTHASNWTSSQRRSPETLETRELDGFIARLLD